MRRVTLGNSPDLGELLPPKKGRRGREAGRGEGALIAPSPQAPEESLECRIPSPRADKFGASLADLSLSWGHWQRCSRHHGDRGREGGDEAGARPKSPPVVTPECRDPD